MSDKRSVTVVQPVEKMSQEFINLSEYNQVQLIQRSHASVFCYEHQTSREKIAVKEIRIKNSDEERQVLQSFQRMQKIFQNPHTNIVDIKGFCKVRTENLNGFDNAYFVAMEYAESNLENFIQNRKQNNENFTFREISNFLCQMISALLHLQKKLQIAHRDLKPENILITQSGLYKLTDFDVAKLRGNKMNEKQQIVGTLEWCAPEIVKGYQRQKEHISYNAYRADVYSLGLCVLYMCTFSKFSLQERIQQVCDKSVSDQQIHLLRRTAKQQYGPKISKILKLMLQPDNISRCDFVQLYSKLVELEFVSDNLKVSKSYILDIESQERAGGGNSASPHQRNSTMSVSGSYTGTPRLVHVEESFRTNPMTETSFNDHTNSTMREARETLKVSYVMQYPHSNGSGGQMAQQIYHSPLHDCTQRATYVGTQECSELDRMQPLHREASAFSNSVTEPLLTRDSIAIEKYKQKAKIYKTVIILLLLILVIVVVLFIVMGLSSKK